MALRIVAADDIKRSLHHKHVELVQIERGWAQVKMLERAPSRRTFHRFEVGEPLWIPLDRLVSEEEEAAWQSGGS